MDLPVPQQSAIAKASQGDAISLPQIPVIATGRASLPGPTLLFSDMPEYIGETNGITLEEQIAPGNYRLYIYHVPGAPNTRRIVSAVVENLSNRPLELRFTRTAFPPPGTDYPKMGIDALMTFFTGTNTPSPLVVPPLGRAVLDPRLDATEACDPQLVHAIYEFSINAPARIRVFQKSPGESSTNIIDTLPRLPARIPGRHSSGAGRGIFPGADLLITNLAVAAMDTSDGVQRLVLADGSRDPWVRGTDSLAGNLAVTNKGSYGVVYHVRLEYKSSDGRAIALLVGGLEGRGRAFAALSVSPGKWKGGWVRSDAGPAGRGPAPAAVVLQKWSPPPSGETRTIDLIYSPPGGSSLPTPIYFAPFREK
jgi:hypothetical protein